ncbi:hypothetical protein F5Y19DRAFT_42251 [Xylariaceae sp. FL1651]|nr:hypothetical protein F5Y19DRAFT_42251 [Xylariaceae sp. FL1651]
MNNSNPTAYTSLETLFLFQLLGKHGFINGSFERISEELKNTPLVHEQEEYDAGRLTPESLQQLALQLLREEQRRDAEAVAEKGANGLSPTSKKRKLQSAPLPTLKEAHEQPEKLPILVDRLYARFRDDLVRRIREDERQYQEREREIDEIERGEWDEKITQKRHEEVVHSNAPADRDVQPLKPNGSAVPTPVTVPAPVTVQPTIQDPTKRSEPTPTPIPPQILQEKRPLQLSPSPAPAVRPISEQQHITPDGRLPQESNRVSNGTTPVLQHPQIAQGYNSHPSSATPQPQPHMPDGSQRLESIPKGRSPAPGQQGQTQTPALKWEPPYQPLHHLPHQTPVPSPRPPYSSGNSRPPSYAPPVQSNPPQASQHAQNYAGGKQPLGQAVSQPWLPTSGNSAPSPPVLLHPQKASQIPPSLQSLPVNATPDGAGQQVPHRRPPVSAVASPSPSVPPNTHVQRQISSVSTPTPIRPPAGPVITHPAITTAAKPSTPAIQRSQPPSSVRPPQPQPHPHPSPRSRQQPIPTTPSHQQAQRITQSYGTPFNQHHTSVGGPDSTQRLQLPAVQTPISTPQASRSSSTIQGQTPIGVNNSSHVIRGHGTKWISTPTPATPRMEDIGGYFDIQSPLIEPISPPMRPAQIPKTSPDQSSKKDSSKPVVKPDINKSRTRPPRVAQKVETTPQLADVAVEPDLPAQGIKDEEATPRALEEAVETTTEERVQSRVPQGTNILSNKRKRQDSPQNRDAPSPATHVLWTRAFHKISMAALDQIIGHRYANMFANPIKPRLAPGYYDIILRPQDLKGIQKAITAGSKAASAAVATMPDIDPNAPSVWLPISIDLVPPRGIINIAQLERELIHMFANAIMYNPDPLRGLGPSFLKSYQSNSEEGDDLRGYEFDENGVVKDTRNMFAEVEKLLGDLRSEVVPRAQAIGTGSRSVSAAVGELSTVEDDGDEQAGDAKRRRIRG